MKVFFIGQCLKIVCFYGREWRYYLSSSKGTMWSKLVQFQLLFDSLLKFCAKKKKKNKRIKFSKKIYKPSTSFEKFWLNNIFFFKRVEKEKENQTLSTMDNISPSQEDYVIYIKKKKKRHRMQLWREILHRSSKILAIILEQFSVSRWPCFYFLFFWST